MSLTLSLTDFSKEQGLALVTKPLYGWATMQALNGKITKLTGIKFKEKLQLFDTDAVFLSGHCGGTESGTTTYSNREITVAELRIEEGICLADFNKKYTQEFLSAGSYAESFSGIQDWSNRKVEVASKQMENAVWRGDTDSATNNLNKFDGWLKVIDSVSGSTVSPSGVTGFTSGNAISVAQAIFNAVPADILYRDDLFIAMGLDHYRTLVNAYYNSNNFNFNITQSTLAGGVLSFTLPATNITVYGFPGMTGSNRIIATYAPNLAFGTDSEADLEGGKLWYSEDDDELKIRVKWKAGCQVYFPDLIVRYATA